jgi:3',5'-cyclic AMP phosphodiesterase CpdA
MKDKIFHKYALVVSTFLLLLITGVKVHSVLTTPKVSDRNFHQLRKIDKSRVNFSFAVFGDNKNSVRTFNSLISRLNKEDILFAIDDGDLVFDGEREKFRFFLDQIKKLDKPLLTVLGNHEARGEGRASYYELFGPFYYSFAVGDSYFIILDDSSEEGLDDAQFAWLKNELKISQKYKNRFVFMHVPLYDPRNKNSEEKYFAHALKDKKFARKLNKLFNRNNVTMLFCSHIHGYFHGVWGKTPYIITGGAGAELSGTDPAYYFYHYVKVSVSDGSVNYKVVKLKSPDFELIDRLLHDAWIYIYAYLAINFTDVLLFLIIIHLGVYIVFVRKEWLLWNFKHRSKSK